MSLTAILDRAKRAPVGIPLRQRRHLARGLFNKPHALVGVVAQRQDPARQKAGWICSLGQLIQINRRERPVSETFHEVHNVVEPRTLVG